MYYIVNSSDDVIAKCAYVPDAADLAQRGERFISADNDYSLRLSKVEDGAIVLSEEPEPTFAYNFKRFMTSLLADSTLSALAKDCYYGALSDCLSTSNWPALNIIAATMIADPDSAGTQEILTLFAAKLATEEGIILT